MFLINSISNDFVSLFVLRYSFLGIVGNISIWKQVERLLECFVAASQSHSLECLGRHPKLWIAVKISREQIFKPAIVDDPGRVPDKHDDSLLGCVFGSINPMSVTAANFDEGRVHQVKVIGLGKESLERGISIHS